MNRVRPAEPADIPELSRLWLTMSDAPNAERDAEVQAFLVDQIGTGSTTTEVLVVNADSGGLAACTAARVHSGVVGCKAHVYLVVTDAPYRRRGYAKALMQQLIVNLQERGCTRVELSSSPEAVPLYAALGFQPTIIWRLPL